MNKETRAKRHAEFIEKVKGDEFQIFGLWRECPHDVKWAWGARTILTQSDRLYCYTTDYLFDRQTSYGDKELLNKFAERFKRKDFGLKTICDISVHIATGGALYELAKGNCGSSKMQEEDEIDEWLAHRSSRELMNGIEGFFETVYAKGLAPASDTEYDILKKLYAWPESPSLETLYPEIDMAYEGASCLGWPQGGKMAPNERRTFTLWHDGTTKHKPQTFIKADTNASHGYLYLIAYEMEDK
jgi:hypothetical protein